MSIELRDISVKIGRGPHFLFENLNLRIETSRRVGILGLPKSGKSTLLRIISGTEPGYEGNIERTSTVSWSIPLSDFLVSSATVATNIRFIGRLYGGGGEAYVRHIGEIAGVTEFFNEELVNCPRFVRSQLSFALGVGTKFDIYLFDDNIATGDKAFKEKAYQIVQSLAADHGIVLATSGLGEIANLDSVFVLDKGYVTYYEDVSEGVKYFKSLTQSGDEAPVVGKAPREHVPAPVEMESVLGI